MNGVAIVADRALAIVVFGDLAAYRATATWAVVHRVRRFNWVRRDGAEGGNRTPTSEETGF